MVDQLARGMRYIASNKAYRAFLERDPQKALWIVTSKAGPMQARVIALNEGLLEEEIARGICACRWTRTRWPTRWSGSWRPSSTPT